MAEAWVLLEYTDEAGKHGIGDPLNLPTDTAEQQATFDLLVSYGIITTKAPRPADTSTTSSGRTRPGRR